MGTGGIERAGRAAGHVEQIDHGALADLVVTEQQWLDQPRRDTTVGRGQPNAGLVGLSGFCGLVIGVLVLAKFPSSADWAIGLLVGIDLIFAGWTLTSVALVGKELSRGAR